MSSLTTTSINTANGATDLTIATGNSSGPAIVVSSGTDVWLRGNSSANVIIANSTALNVNVNSTFTKNVTVTNTITLNSVANGASFSGNTTFANVVATRITSTNATITSNSLSLGLANIATSGYSRLPNGLLFQWGSQTGITFSNSTITFQVPFAAPPYTISVQPTHANTGSTLAVTAISTTTATVRTTNTTTAQTAYWMAIGV